MNSCSIAWLSSSVTPPLSPSSSTSMNSFRRRYSSCSRRSCSSLARLASSACRDHHIALHHTPHCTTLHTTHHTALHHTPHTTHHTALHHTPHSTSSTLQHTTLHYNTHHTVPAPCYITTHCTTPHTTQYQLHVTTHTTTHCTCFSSSCFCFSLAFLSSSSLKASRLFRSSRKTSSCYREGSVQVPANEPGDSSSTNADAITPSTSLCAFFSAFA